MATNEKDRSDANPYAAPQSRLGPSAAGSRDKFQGRSLTSAPFSVECSCGRAIGVNASQAGSTIRCECGDDVAVPSLGKWRESAGKGRYESSLSDTILSREIRMGRAHPFSPIPRFVYWPPNVLVSVATETCGHESGLGGEPGLITGKFRNTV